MPSEQEVLEVLMQFGKLDPFESKALLAIYESVEVQEEAITISELRKRTKLGSDLEAYIDVSRNSGYIRVDDGAIELTDKGRNFMQTVIERARVE